MQLISSVRNSSVRYNDVYSTFVVCACSMLHCAECKATPMEQLATHCSTGLDLVNVQVALSSL